MNRMGHQFLTGPRFPTNKHRRIAACDLVYRLVNVPHRTGIADNILRPKSVLQLVPQQLPVWPSREAVGDRAADVNPKFPRMITVL